MKEEVVKVNLKVGLHARPAAIFVQKASKFLSSIYLELDGKRVEGKSIIGVMSLGVAHGAEVKLITRGEDEEEAMAELKEFLQSDFED